MKILLMLLAVMFSTTGVASVLPAVEYYNKGFDHYFVTADPNEIADLDTKVGWRADWAKTGQTFNVESSQTTLSKVCRFFSASFAPKSSHFYTVNQNECNIVKNNPDWVFEGITFNVEQPSASGECPSGYFKVYRLYNNGMGGAPNHRFTTSETVRSDMIRRGWIPEGFGAGVTFCSPPAPQSDVAFLKMVNLIGGVWQFNYKYGSYITEYFKFDIVIRNTSNDPASVADIPYFAIGYNIYDNVVAAGYMKSLNRILLFSPIGTFGGKNYADWFLFDYSSANAVAGCYYFDQGTATNPFNSPCTVFTGKRNNSATVVESRRFDILDVQEKIFNRNSITDIIPENEILPGINELVNNLKSVIR